MSQTQSVTATALRKPIEQLKRAITSFEHKKEELIFREGVFLMVMGESPTLRAAIAIYNGLADAMRDYERNKNVNVLLEKCQKIFDSHSNEVQLLATHRGFKGILNSIISAINWVANRISPQDTPFINPFKTDSAKRLDTIQDSLSDVRDASEADIGPKTR